MAARTLFRPRPAPAPRTYICAGCGYGISPDTRSGLPRCPTCRIQSWRPERRALRPATL